MSSEFIHDPEGIVLFEEPTSVEVSSGGVNSSATVRVLPFSARREGNVFWGGPDTYRVPEDADFTVLEGLDLTVSDIDVDIEDGEAISLTSLLAEE